MHKNLAGLLCTVMQIPAWADSAAPPATLASALSQGQPTVMVEAGARSHLLDLQPDPRQHGCASIFDGNRFVGYACADHPGRATGHLHLAGADGHTRSLAFGTPQSSAAKYLLPTTACLEPPGGLAPTDPARNATSRSKQSVVTVGIMFTPAAASATGNTTQLAQTMIGSFNATLTQAGITQGELALAGVSTATGYVESPLGICGDFRNAYAQNICYYDGPISTSALNVALNSFRNAINADLVVLITSGQVQIQGSPRGFAGNYLRTAAGISEWLAVVDGRFALADLTFHHEVGHLLGGLHISDSSVAPAGHTGYGWTSLGLLDFAPPISIAIMPGEAFPPFKMSIMGAYEGCTNTFNQIIEGCADRGAYWSNPNHMESVYFMTYFMTGGFPPIPVPYIYEAWVPAGGAHIQYHPKYSDMKSHLQNSLQFVSTFK